MVWGVFSFGSMVVATKLATSMASKGWKLATGRSASVKGDDDNEKYAEQRRRVDGHWGMLDGRHGKGRRSSGRACSSTHRRPRATCPQGLVHMRLTRNEKKKEQVAGEGQGEGRADG